jgi:hypothetical protein
MIDGLNRAFLQLAPEEVITFDQRLRVISIRRICTLHAQMIYSSNEDAVGYLLDHFDLIDERSENLNLALSIKAPYMII